MDLLHLVDRFEEVIASAQKMPIGNRVIIDRRQLLDLIDQMRVFVPEEVHEARQLVADRDAVLEAAEEEAAHVRERAREVAEQMVTAHAITEAARARAQEIADEAEQRLIERVDQANQDIAVRIAESRDLARQQMEGADQYAAELLGRLDRQLGSFVRSVQDGLDQLSTERDLPAPAQAGEFDPGPPRPGSFRSDDALGSLPEHDATETPGQFSNDPPGPEYPAPPSRGPLLGAGASPRRSASRTVDGCTAREHPGSLAVGSALAGREPAGTSRAATGRARTSGRAARSRGPGSAAASSSVDHSCRDGDAGSPGRTGSSSARADRPRPAVRRGRSDRSPIAARPVADRHGRHERRVGRRHLDAQRAGSPARSPDGRGAPASRSRYPRAHR